MGEVFAYASGLILPPLLVPIVSGAIPSPVMRTGVLGMVSATLILTGVLMRVRWPLSWIPSAILGLLLAVALSPWHALTVSVECLCLLVFFGTQVWPHWSDETSAAAVVPLLKIGAFGVSSAIVAFAILRMTVLSGFPITLAQALENQRVALVYLQDNKGALKERPPVDLPWALYAAKYADPLALEAVLAKGARLDAYNWNAMGTPLQWFAANVDSNDRFAETKAEILSRYGAPSGGAVIAAHRNLTGLTRTLIALGDDFNRPASGGVTPMGTLIENNSIRLVDSLLAAGVSPIPASASSLTVSITIPSDEMWVVLNNHGIAGHAIFNRARAF